MPRSKRGLWMSMGCGHPSHNGNPSDGYNKIPIGGLMTIPQDGYVNTILTMAHMSN